MDTKDDLKVKKDLVNKLRKRAAKARRNANIALLSIFILIFSAISLFYFAGNIVVSESKPIQTYLR
jgi:ABC-type Na+ efflux pump permease subunit